MSRDRLRRAVHDDDRELIRALGWAPVFEALDRMWARKLEGIDRVAYASVVGDHDPQVVLDALLGLARSGSAEWRPKPGQLAAALPKGDGPRTNAVATALREDCKPDTLIRVRKLIDEGALVCECIGGRNFKDAGGVLVCLGCNGLERGQADNAMEMENAA